MANKKYVLASDIGGTHITSAIVDCSNWKIIQQTISRLSVDADLDAKSIFLCWTSNMQHTLTQFPQEIDGIGIAIPGPFDYEKGVSLIQNQGKYESLYKVDVSAGIHANLPKAYTLKYINDAAAFLQGEIFAEQLNHKSKVLGITLGTGLGSAVWQSGQKSYDANLWNSPYKDSIFEEYLVTRWFTSRFKELSGYDEIGFKEIREKHMNSEALHTLMQEYSQSLLDFLAFFSTKYGTSSFVIGGSIAKAWDFIKSYRLDDFNCYDIVVGKHEEKAAIIGAASLFKV